MKRSTAGASGFGALILTWAAAAQAPDLPPGGVPGGPIRGFRMPEFPRPGQILTTTLQETLKLTPEQKKQVAELQKTVDAELAKVLTDEQQKSLKGMQPGRGGAFGLGGPRPGRGRAPGEAPPGGTPGGPPPRFGPGGGGGFGGPFGGMFGGQNPDDLRKRLDATEEQWKVIGPKVQKIAALRRTLRGEAPQFGAPAGPNALAQAQNELRAVLDKPSRTQAELDEKLAAVRTAREQALVELAAAEKDLRLLLTPGQQAILVGLGPLGD